MRYTYYLCCCFIIILLFFKSIDENPITQWHFMIFLYKSGIFLYNKSYIPPKKTYSSKIIIKIARQIFKKNMNILFWITHSSWVRYPKEITERHYGFVPSVSSSRDEWKNFLCTIRRKKNFHTSKKAQKMSSMILTGIFQHIPLFYV